MGIGAEKSPGAKRRNDGLKLGQFQILIEHFGRKQAIFKNHYFKIQFFSEMQSNYPIDCCCALVWGWRKKLISKNDSKMPHAPLTYSGKIPGQQWILFASTLLYFRIKIILNTIARAARASGQRDGHWTGGDSTSDVVMDIRGAPLYPSSASLFLKSHQSKEMRSVPVWRLTRVRLETGYNDSVWIMEASISVSHSNIVTLSGCLFIRTRTGHRASHPAINKCHYR